jgi:hypothetical protein
VLSSTAASVPPAALVIPIVTGRVQLGELYRVRANFTGTTSLLAENTLLASELMGCVASSALPKQGAAAREPPEPLFLPAHRTQATNKVVCDVSYRRATSCRSGGRVRASSPLGS